VPSLGDYSADLIPKPEKKKKKKKKKQ